VDTLRLSFFNGGKGQSVMSEADPSHEFNSTGGRVIEIDTELFSKLLLVASAAGIYRRLMADYLANQVQLVEQGKTVEELVMTNWRLFEEVARAEARLFAALDDLDNQGRAE
jgi:hypothetical protein